MKFYSNINKGIVVFFLFYTLLSTAQKNCFSKTYTQTFEKVSQSLYTSEVFSLDIDESYQFITLSAFCSNKTIETELRFRTYASSWSEWKELREDKEITSLDRKTYGNIPIFGRINKIQFLSSKPISDVFSFRLFVAVSDSEFQIEEIPNISKRLFCDLPDFCNRSCWCPEGDCAPQNTPSTTESTHIIVHHSGNNYPPGTNYALVVKSFWDYHVNTHGWNDIGYNWLVDPNGVLYEGRGDSVQGAHFSCMNANTMGVCVIGNFEEVVPTEEAISMLENLIAWEATDKDIDVLTTGYHPPSQLTLYHVSGHQDGNSSPVGCPSGTVCPGTNLYSQLPMIRDDVSNFPCYSSASVFETSFLQDIKVYPNPVSELLIIDNLGNSPIEKVSIFNTIERIKTIYTTTNNIEFTNYNSGIYFVKITDTKGRNTVIKILKE